MKKSFNAAAWASRPSCLLAIAIALVMAGCSVGPDYHAPNLAAPSQWNSPTPAAPTNSGDALAEWWANFHDSELDSLISRALQTNLDLQMAAARLRAARAEKDIAHAGYFPTIDGSASYTRERISRNGFPPVAQYIKTPLSDLYSAGFDASWEIDVFGGTRRAVESAKAELAASKLNAEGTRISLVAEVARNYLGARGAQERIAIANENINAQKEQVAINQERVDRGLTNELGLEQSKSLLATTQSQVPVLETALQAYIHHLGVLLAQTPDSLEAELSASAPIPPNPPLVPVGLPSELLKRRPDVMSAERQLAAANAQIGVAKADLFPKFYLTGSAGFSSVDSSDWFTAGSKMWSIAPSVEWRIFDAGRIRANIRMQRALTDEASVNYRQTVLNSLEDVENALVAYAKEQEHQRLLRDAAQASERAAKLAVQLYDKGVASYLNVLDAERSLYESQDALTQSRQAVAVDLVALYKALGGGWDAGDSDKLAQNSGGPKSR